jgi:glycosyltransferase involved in cell wall biosynthesis
MKILQIVPYFYPFRGGQEKYIYNLSKYLVKMGHEIHIITSNYPKTQNEEIIEGITIERHKCLGRPLRNPLTPGFLKLGNSINDYDLIHTHNEHSSAAFASYYYHRNYKINYIITCHGQLVFGTVIEDFLKNIYFNSIGMRILKNSSAICVNSILDGEYLASFNHRFNEKVELFSNAIDPRGLEKIFKNAKESDLRFALEKNEIIILYVGRLIRRKGLDYLITALAYLKTNQLIKKFLMIFVGSGEDKAFFESLVKRYNLSDCVKFTGEVSDEDLYYLYKTSDIFILPSLSEVCPTVVLEAMYFGLPVIATDIPGIRDHFNDTAILIPPRNYIEIAYSIIKLIDDKRLSKILSIKANKSVLSTYTWEKVAEKYESLYRKVINGK